MSKNGNYYNDYCSGKVKVDNTGGIVDNKGGVVYNYHSFIFIIIFIY